MPYGDQALTVSTHMLADALAYQQAAVRKALDPQHIRPRILIADAVGLGKTLEIGMILAELVRRGRGERILVVTPQHVLEQIQHELWTPLRAPARPARLDRHPAGAPEAPGHPQPVHLLQAGHHLDRHAEEPTRYKAHLERQQWDAVVIDESHNLINAGTQNNELARVLAPNTEALILASATPHNGREESFAELIRLLDPTAVAADGTFTKARRRVTSDPPAPDSPEVAAEVGGDWAERAEPVHLLVEAVTRRGRVVAELRGPGCAPTAESRPYSGDTKALFPWTLAKAFLSSPAALAETIKQRRAKLDQRRPEQRVELDRAGHARRAERRRAARASRQVRRARRAAQGHRRRQGIGDAGRRLRRARRDADAGSRPPARSRRPDRRQRARCCTAACPTSSSRRSSRTSSWRPRPSGCWSPATSPPRA